MSAKYEFVYRATCSHGKVHMITADIPEMDESNAEEIAKYLRAGMTIDRVSVEVARKSDMFCDECQGGRHAR